MPLMPVVLGRSRQPPPEVSPGAGGVGNPSISHTISANNCSVRDFVHLECHVARMRNDLHLPRTPATDRNAGPPSSLGSARLPAPATQSNRVNPGYSAEDRDLRSDSREVSGAYEATRDPA